MKHRIPSTTRFSLPLAALLALGVTPVARAADYIWDAGDTNNGAAIDPASGNWKTTADILVWNNAGAKIFKNPEKRIMASWQSENLDDGYIGMGIVIDPKRIAGFAEGRLNQL